MECASSDDTGTLDRMPGDAESSSARATSGRVDSLATESRVGSPASARSRRDSQTSTSISSLTTSFVAGFGKEGRITNRADRISSADDEEVPVKSSPVNGDDPLEDEPAPPVTLAAVRRRTRAGGVGSARTSATGSPPRSARRFESVLRCEPARIASDPPSVHVAIGAPLDTADTSSPAASVTLGGPPGPAAATPSTPARSTTLETLARTGSTNTIERASFPDPTPVVPLVAIPRPPLLEPTVTSSARRVGLASRTDPSGRSARSGSDGESGDRSSRSPSAPPSAPSAPIGTPWSRPACIAEDMVSISASSASSRRRRRRSSRVFTPSDSPRLAAGTGVTGPDASIPAVVGSNPPPIELGFRVPPPGT